MVSLRKITNSYRKRCNKVVKEDILCSDSFHETVNRCAAIDLEHFNLKSFLDSYQPILPKKSSLLFPNTVFTPFLDPNPPPSVQVQSRTFKTFRNLASEDKRNPSLLKRLQVFFAGGDDVKLTSEFLNNQQLKHMIAKEGGESVSDALKQKLKVAFAEGYLVANSLSTEKSRKTLRYFKMLQYLFTLCIFIIIAINILSNSAGSIFRYVSFELSLKRKQFLKLQIYKKEKFLKVV